MDTGVSAPREAGGRSAKPTGGWVLPASEPKLNKKAWWVYVVVCEGGALYTGISPDPEKRFKAHQSGRGAAFMRLRKPLAIVSIEFAGAQGQALRREAQIKGLSSLKKKIYIEKSWELPWPDAKAPIINTQNYQRKKRRRAAKRRVRRSAQIQKSAGPAAAAGQP